MYKAMVVGRWTSSEKLEELEIYGVFLAKCVSDEVLSDRAIDKASADCFYSDRVRP